MRHQHIHSWDPIYVPNKEDIFLIKHIGSLNEADVWGCQTYPNFPDRHLKRSINLRFQNIFWKLKHSFNCVWILPCEKYCSQNFGCDCEGSMYHPITMLSWTGLVTNSLHILCYHTGPHRYIHMGTPATWTRSRHSRDTQTSRGVWSFLHQRVSGLETFSAFFSCSH